MTKKYQNISCIKQMTFMLMLRDFYAELHMIIKHKLSHRGDLNFN